MNNLLATYNNGPVKVSIYDDGTKIREWNDEKYGLTPKLEFAESFDCKITEYCDLGCPQCHEQSSVNGAHGDLYFLDELIEKSSLPSGIEIAIGGGNPCSHPGLTWFLKKAKERGHIVNLTMNYAHLMGGQYRYQIFYYLLNGLIKGLGISVTDFSIEYFLEDTELQNASSNIVLHIIEGMNSFDDVSKQLLYPNLRWWNNPKILILGYKHFGRGNRYAEVYEIHTQEWKDKIIPFLKEFKGVVSFDNLAIDRLDLLNQLPKEIITERYMGEDGTHTMYIDLVKEEFAKQSTSSMRKPFGEMNLRKMYEDVFNNRKDWK